MVKAVKRVKDGSGKKRFSRSADYAYGKRTQKNSVNALLKA